MPVAVGSKVGVAVDVCSTGATFASTVGDASAGGGVVGVNRFPRGAQAKITSKPNR